MMDQDLPTTSIPHTPADDWLGLTDPKERRRRQNRLNQRAHRKRKQAQQDPPDADTGPSKPATKKPSSTTTITTTTLSQRQRHRTPQSNCPDPSTLTILLARFSRTTFPLTPSPTADPTLHLTLTKANVFRAFAHIITLLGMTPTGTWMHDDAISPFSTHGPITSTLDNHNNNLPPSLRPTRVQRECPHHPWLDFFPFPRMRDNLIRAGDSFDDEMLCVDIMGFWDVHAGGGGGGDGGGGGESMMVWGEPTDPRSWEVSEAFLKRWPWVVRGSPEIMESTNYWRGVRGERLIFRYL